MKPPAEVVRKKHDNAVEIMCSLLFSIDINLFSDVYTLFVVEVSRRSCS